MIILGSTVSLIMGLTFGGLSGYGAYLTSQDARNYGLLLGKLLNVPYPDRHKTGNPDYGQKVEFPSQDS